jgi:lipid II:glycine glycyltransferase (peptidoglycan interpeptide bridge formation enzyme)
MEIFNFSKQEQLNGFIKTACDNRGSEFLQSWEWGDFLLSEGNEILRLGARSSETGKILAAGTFIKKSLPFFPGWFYWYSPRGPLGDVEAIKFLLMELKRREPGTVFVRFEPQGDIEGLKKDFSPAIVKSLDLQPRRSLLLDLSVDEKELLAAMHQKTRYNIRLAEKKGIEITEGGEADFEEFWRLMTLTGNRDNFRLHSRRHYRQLLKEPIKLFFARYQGRNIAAGLFCFWGNKAVYLHGASDNEFRGMMAPYLLQWSMIKRAKKNAYLYYDFYGIDNLKWPGVTRFKSGFGGREIIYPGTFDAVCRPACYKIYNLIRRIRRIF